MAEQATAASNQPLSEEEIIKWSRESYQKAIGHLAEKGIVADSVSMEQSRYLAPILAVWKIKSADQRWFWVISGDLPTDWMTEEGAESARDAVRAFSLRWQLKAEEIRVNQEADKTQQEFATLLIGRANGLYDIYEREELWQQS